MNPEWGDKNIIPGNLVVDTITGRTAEVYKVLPRFGVQVWVKERGYERENWPWAMCTVRFPRLIKRYPRPIRYPREKPSLHCHCRIGRIIVENIEARAVRCQRCKNLIGSESFPRRIERATDMLRKADRQKPALQKPEVQEGIQKHHKPPQVRRGVSTRKKTKPKSSSRVVVRHRRRPSAKTKASKNRGRQKTNHPPLSKTRRTKKVPTPIAQVPPASNQEVVVASKESTGGAVV